MRKNLKMLVVLSIVLAAASLAAFIGSFEASQLSSIFHHYHGNNPADLDFYYLARTVFSTINIVLLVVLTGNYAYIFSKTKSEFTVGLMLFSVFFLIKDITWSPFVVRGAGFDVFGLGPFAFLPDLFELIALSVLLYLSVEY